jgi:hypothetical protein
MSVLIEHHEGQVIPKENLIIDGRVAVDSKHARISQLVAFGILSEDESEQLFRFCGVRNPFDSIVSLFEKTRSRYVRQLNNPDHFIHRSPRQLEAVRVISEGFPAWLRVMYTRDLSKPPAHLEAALNERMDYVVRFESLQSDLDEVMAKLDLESRAVPQLNVTGRTPEYRSYYDDESRELVERRFALDLDRFGYQF